MLYRIKAYFVLALVLTLSTQVMADSYTLDPAHADVGFTVKHLGINKVRGHFGGFSGTLDYDGQNIESVSLTMKIETKSVDTGIEKRDEHLRNADFFDVETFPEMMFKTKRVRTHGDDQHLVGIMTIKGVSKEVKLDVEISGPIDSPFEPGVKLVGFHATGSINRQDFGVAPEGVSDKLVGDTVRIELNIEAKTGMEQVE